jgi:pimeloyl-ACP methyl ester carboxylesterase
MISISSFQLPLADLLLIAGLIVALLLVIRLLLRRPQPGYKPRNSIFRRLRLTGFALVAFLIIGGSVLVYEDLKATDEDLMPTPSEVEIPNDLPFRVEEVTFIGGDNLKMAGWFVPPRNDATIILLHGYGGNRTGMIWHAAKLIRAGYGVLMYDERASGESEGAFRSYGWQDASDVGGAVRYLRGRTDAGRVGIAGCSIGAQIALQGAAYYPEIQAVWADGPSVIRASDHPAPTNWATALAVLSNYIIDQMYVWRLKIDPPKPMTDIIGTIAPRPIMLVAGGTPHPHFGAEAARAEHYARIAGTNATVWVIPEATHCDGPLQRPDEYAMHLVEFFDAAFDVK